MRLTWIRLSSGEHTTTGRFASSAGTWKQSDFPADVGMNAVTSFPRMSAIIISACRGRNREKPNRVLTMCKSDRYRSFPGGCASTSAAPAAGAGASAAATGGGCASTWAAPAAGAGASAAATGSGCASTWAASACTVLALGGAYGGAVSELMLLELRTAWAPACATVRWFCGARASLQISSPILTCLFSVKILYSLLGRG